VLLTEDFRARWEKIVDQVDKEHVPIDCVKKVVFRTQDRKQRTINLRRLRSQGIDEEGIEKAIENFIADNEDDIMSMEFVLDVDAVAQRLQPETDKLLKGMK
jgi:Asp-tRNA(Asn)/Glu-tRNA(Gln) amidotransferase B subunit